MTLKGWRSEVALADITGYVVVTRCTDPAKNTDKYRRFITLSVPNEPHLHVHHTGRWTVRTDQGRWIEGVWRPQGTAKSTTQRRYPSPEDFNNVMVQRKLGAYRIVEPSRMLTSSEISDVINRANLRDNNPAPAPAPTTPAPATAAYLKAHPTRPISGQPPKQVVVRGGSEASTPVDDPNAKLAQLLVRATGNEDPFDLLADLAAVKRQVQVAIDAAREMEDQLKLVTETVMAKVASV